MFRSYEDICRTPVKVKQEEPSTSKSVQKYLSCEFCEIFLNSETELLAHKEEHQEDIDNLIKEGRQFCSACLNNYNSKKELRRHFIKSHLMSSERALRVEREIFICSVCNHVFFNKQMLVLHQVFIHKCPYNGTALPCPHCNKKFHKLKELRTHIYHHFTTSFVTCPLCMCKIDSWDDLLIHLSTHPKHLYCYACDSHFVNVEAFREHALRHQNEIYIDPKVFLDNNKQTKIASKYFIPQQKRFSAIYKMKRPFFGLKIPPIFKICVLCREICISKKDKLIQHFRWHVKRQVLQDMKTLFQCECGKEFEYKILLKQHKTKCTVETLDREVDEPQMSANNLNVINKDKADEKVENENNCEMMEIQTEDVMQDVIMSATNADYRTELPDSVQVEDTEFKNDRLDYDVKDKIEVSEEKIVKVGAIDNGDDSNCKVVKVETIDQLTDKNTMTIDTEVKIKHLDGDDDFIIDESASEVVQEDNKEYINKDGDVEVNVESLNEDDEEEVYIVIQEVEEDSSSGPSEQ